MISLTALSAPTAVRAIDFDVTKITKIFKTVYGGAKKYKTINKIASDEPHTFAFGGHITHSEGGCAVKYTVHIRIFILGIPVVVPFPGVPIPLGGDTIEVGPPLSGPPGQMFTFPGISDVYSNHSEGRVGPWALGLGFAPFPIDKINEALDELPSIPPGGCGQGQASEVCMDNFHLDCSDNNKNVILKLGTSK